MSSISSQLPISELSSRQNQQSGSRAGAYVKEQSFSFKESLDSNIVLQTQEGDKVSITAGSFSQMDAYLYDSKGYSQTDSGAATYSTSQQEIALASGASFAFSVDGSLSDEELADIETMLKDLDGVISEMKAGDMDEAFAQAMEMGGYDTVSSFSADISFKQSYEMQSYTAAALAQTLPAETEAGEAEQTIPTEAGEKSGKGQSNKYGHYDPFEKFFEKVVDQLEKHDDKLVGIAKNPINNLFKHHLEEVHSDEGENTALFDSLSKMMERVDSLIDEWLAKADEIEEVGETTHEQVEAEAPTNNEDQETPLA